MTKQIAILDRGWVFVGDCAVVDGVLTISAAHCVRRWGTSKGLGELAMAGPLPGTVLELYGIVRSPMTAVIALIDCEAGKWTS